MIKMNDKYIKEYEEMSLYDLADELVEPLFTVKQDLSKTIYIHYAKERDKNEQLQNNWNELKKWLEEDLKEVYRDAGYRHNIVRELLDEMQELEGNNE